MFDNPEPIHFIGPFDEENPPQTLSDALWLAAEEVEALPNSIDLFMSSWCRSDGDKLCSVCAAGAVAIGLGDTSQEEIMQRVRSSGPWCHALAAIDSARHGLLTWPDPRLHCDLGTNEWYSGLVYQRRETTARHYQALAQAVMDGRGHAITDQGIAAIKERYRQYFHGEREMPKVLVLRNIATMPA